MIIPATTLFAPGVKLGPYDILSPLGAGGMGEVYRARDKRPGRDMALKVLPELGTPSAWSRPILRDSFSRNADEVQANARTR
jgi:eukaryotic-like serine/threonine-protein kinase